MNVDKQTCFQLVDAIRSKNLSRENLHALKGVVAQNGSSELVDALIGKEKAAGKCEDDAVSETMLHLESLGDTAPFLACVLMARLLPISGRLLLHDIHDGVGLWMDHFPSKELVRELRLIAASEPNPRFRQKYEETATHIENVRKKKSPGR